MVNAVLHWINQNSLAGTLRQNGIPGLITTKLRDVQRDGLPCLPPGVDGKLAASLGVDDNYNLLEYMTKVSFTCLLADFQPVLAFTLYSTESTNIQIALLLLPIDR